MRGQYLGLGLSLNRRGAAAEIVYDADAQDYFDRVVVAGGTVNAATRGYVNTLVLSLKADDVWTHIRRMNLFASDGFVGADVPIVKLFGSTLDYFSGHVSGDFDPLLGITNNGASKYIHTNADPANISHDAINSLNMFAFITDFPSFSGPDRRRVMGVNDGSQSVELSLNGFSGDQLAGRIGASSDPETIEGISPYITPGLYGAGKPGYTSCEVYRNGSPGSFTETVTEFDETLFLQGEIAVGVWNAPFFTEYLEASLGGYLMTASPVDSPAQFFGVTRHAALNTALQAFMASMGRI